MSASALTRSTELAMLRRLRSASVISLLAVLPAGARAQRPAASTKVIAEVRAAVRHYDDALRRADTAAVGRFWASEYVFVNARGERVTRAARLANLRAGRTALDSLAHASAEEQINVYGDVAVYATLLTLRSRYSGKEQEGKFRASVVWVRRDGRWQQVASQMTQVVAP
jgi:ketosteroid isomerase-like protein